MRTYTWDEYYEKFYEWSESTQVRNLYALTSLGLADEVAEIIIELQGNVSASNRLLKKAIEAKLVFSSIDLAEFAWINDKELVIAAVHNCADWLTADDMEYLYGEIDDEIIIEICNQYNILLPEELREEEEYEDNYIDDYILEESMPKIGFFGIVGAFFAGLFSGGRRKHNGVCDGDCTHCPPHYGYRYGRWYYGHDHAHGCEFGGNKCSGSMD